MRAAAVNPAAQTVFISHGDCREDAEYLAGVIRQKFGIRDIDLTLIESRPTRVELGTYVFFLDCVGHVDDAAVAEALAALHRRCADVRYLGSWPTGAAVGAAPPPLDEAARWLAELREGRR